MGFPSVFLWCNDHVFSVGNPTALVLHLVPRVHEALAILVELADGVDRQIHALVPRSLENE